MKRKILFIFIFIFIFMFVGLFFNTPNKTEADTVSATDIVNKYYNGGVYTKKTEMFLTEETVNQFKEHFHVNATMNRTTYYSGDYLLMGDFDGGFEEVNSGFRTDGNNMKHFTYQNGSVVDDYTVSGTNIHDYYIMLDDMMVSGYFDDFVRENNRYVYTVTNMDGGVESKLHDFLWLSAPGLEDSIFNQNQSGNYFIQSGMKLVLEEKVHPYYGNYLSIKILVNIIDVGKVNTEDEIASWDKKGDLFVIPSEDVLVLSEARVYQNLSCFNENDYLDKEFTVTWKNADGSVLESDLVRFGDTPTYDGVTPTKSSTNEFEYEFIGWDKEIEVVTGDIIYTATYYERKIEMESKIINVYLIGGQSNSVGYGMDTNNAIANSDSRFVNGFENVLYYGAHERWSGEVLNKTFQPVKLGMGVAVDRSGAEIGIASAIADNGEMNAIIRCAWGATHLYPDYNYFVSTNIGTWTSPSYIEKHNVDLSKNPNIGRMYSWFEETVTDGIKLLLEEGYTPVIKGMWWMQGEAEMGAKVMSDSYEELLRTLITDIRCSLSDITGYDCSDMPFVFGLPSWNPSVSGAPAYEEEVRNSMSKVANDTTFVNAACVDTRGLTQHDGWHFDAAGQKYLGEQFVEALKNLNEGKYSSYKEHVRINSEFEVLPQENGLKFTANLTNYNSINNYEYGFIVVENDKLIANNINSDFVTQLNNKGISYRDIKSKVLGEKIGNNYQITIEGSIKDINYKDFNTLYTAIAFIKDEGGNYQYSSSNLTNSLSRCASKALYTSSLDKSMLQKIVNAGVNYKLGVSEDKMYNQSNFQLVVDSSVDLLYSQTKEVNNLGLEQNPNMGYYVEYKSNNTNVLSVDENGNLQMNNPGKATITINCGGLTKEVLVNVNSLTKDGVTFDGVISSGEYKGDVYEASNANTTLKYTGKVVNGIAYLAFEFTHNDWSSLSSQWYNNDNIEFRLNDRTDSYKVVFYDGIPEFKDGINFGVAKTKEVNGKLVTTVELYVEGTADLYQLQLGMNGKNVGWLGAAWGYNANSVSSSTSHAQVTIDGIKVKQPINVNSNIVLDGNLTEGYYTNTVKNNALTVNANGANLNIIGTMVDGGVLLGVTVNHTKDPNVSTNGGTNWFNYMNIEFRFNNKSTSFLFNSQNLMRYGNSFSYCKSVNNGSGYTSTFEIYIPYEALGISNTIDSVEFTCNGWFESGWSWFFGSNASWTATHTLTKDGITVIKDIDNMFTFDGVFDDEIWSSVNTKNNLSVDANGADVNIVGTLLNDGVLFGVTVNHTKAPDVSTDGGTAWNKYMNIEFQFNGGGTQFIYSCLNKQYVSAFTGYAKTVNNGSNYTTTFEIYIPFNSIGVSNNLESIDFTCSGWFESGWCWFFKDNQKWTATHTLKVDGIRKIGDIGNVVTFDGEMEENVWSNVNYQNNLQTTANGAELNIVGTVLENGVLFGVTVDHTKAPDVSTNGGSSWYNYMNIEFHFNGGTRQFIYTCMNRQYVTDFNGYAKTTYDGSKYQTTFEIYVPFKSIGMPSGTTSVDFTCAGWFETGWCWIFKNNWNPTHTVSKDGISAITTAKEDVLNVLMISNSFGDDTKQWVHEIANEYGVKINVANLYIGGCVLETHLSNLKNNLPAYYYRYYSNGTWYDYSATAISQALGYLDWDIVMLQQGSSQSGVADKYSYLDEIMDRVTALKSDVKFIWNMTWAYEQDSGHSHFGTYNNDQMTMYNAILNAVQTKVLPNSRIEYVIPNGTAVQNARTSYIGDTLCRDVYCHLTYDFGRYIAGLTFFTMVTGIDISNIKYSPGLTDYDKAIAIESVKNALANPYKITNSKYTSEPEIDLTKYTKINWNPTVNSYWYSTSSTSLVTSGSLAPNFVSSKKFTKAELPVGTIIEIKSGYQYRPDGWTTNGVLTPTSLRPGNITTRYVVVTEEWWGDFIYRGFNISNTANSSLVGNTDAAIAAFNIYVPK